MIVMENTQQLKINSNQLKMLGIGLIKIPKNNSNGEFDLLYQKGIGLPLIQNIIELYRREILEKTQGNSIIPIDEKTIFIQYFNNNEDIYLIIFMDDKESDLNYPQLYFLVKKIKNSIRLRSSLPEIKDLCNSLIKIPQATGISAVFILGYHGTCFISKINEERKSIINMELHISGFISAIFSFSTEILGQESGAKLKEINFGNQVLFMISKNNVIFAYLVETLNPMLGKYNHLLERYMYLIPDEFSTQYRQQIENFDGDITPFHKFEKILNQYFKI